MVLAIDAATVTGFCVGAPNGKIIHGSIRFGKPGQDRAVTYRALRGWMADTLSVYSPSLVVFESAAVPMVMQGKTNADTIKKLIGMTEHIEEFCYQKVELREARASEVRAHFLGSNRHKSKEAKALTIAKCVELGHEVKDDNAADAVALWYYQMAHLRPDLAYKSQPLFYGKRPIPPPQEEV